MDYMLALPSNENVRVDKSAGCRNERRRLNDIRGRHITREDVFNASRPQKAALSMKARSVPEQDRRVRLERRHRHRITKTAG